MRKARRGLRGAAGHAGAVNDNSDLKSESVTFKVTWTAFAILAIFSTLTIFTVNRYSSKMYPLQTLVSPYNPI